MKKLLLLPLFIFPFSASAVVFTPPDVVELEAMVMVSEFSDQIYIYDASGNPLNAYGALTPNVTETIVDTSNFTNGSPILPIGEYRTIECDSAIETLGSQALYDDKLLDPCVTVVDTFNVIEPPSLPTPTLNPLFSVSSTTCLTVGDTMTCQTTSPVEVTYHDWLIVNLWIIFFLTLNTVGIFFSSTLKYTKRKF